MPQDLHVVKCYKCSTYQVDIVKKVKKWTCKMCGEKQSLVKVYGGGSGRDCRELVQRLNARRISEGDDSFVEAPVGNCSRALQSKDTEMLKVSKWAEFMPAKAEPPGQDDLNIYQTSSSLNNNCDKSVNDNIKSRSEIEYFSDYEKENNVRHIKKKRKVQKSVIKIVNQSQSSHSKWSEFLTDTDLYTNPNTLDENKSFEEIVDNETTKSQLMHKNNSLYDTKRNMQQVNEVNSENKLNTMSINQLGNEDVHKDKLNTIFQSHENDIDSILDF